MKGILCPLVLLLILSIVEVAQESADVKQGLTKPQTVDEENAARMKPLLIGATITIYGKNIDGSPGGSNQITITQADVDDCTLSVRLKRTVLRPGMPAAEIDESLMFNLLDVELSGVFVKRDGTGFNVVVPAIGDADRVTRKTLSIDNKPNGMTLKHSWTEYGFADQENAKRFVAALKESVARCRQIKKP